MQLPTRDVFLRQLRYWSLHCSINALPSLGIALFFLGLWKNVEGVAAMLSAMATFILLYTALTSLRGPLSNEGHVLSRSLRLGTKIRSWISGISLLMLPLGPTALLMPDLWCGFLSISILNQASRLLGLEIALPTGGPPNSNVGFLSIYATTMLEGFIISFLLLMISFFALFFVHRKAHRRISLGYPAFGD
ncbi:MAG: hypothetical protein WCH40_07820, partial [Verrucomicrobiales bacterium]